MKVLFSNIFDNEWITLPKDVHPLLPIFVDKQLMKPENTALLTAC